MADAERGDVGTPVLDDISLPEGGPPVSGSGTPTQDEGMVDNIPLPAGDHDPRDTPVEDENPEPQESLAAAKGAPEADNLSMVSNNSLLELRNDKNDDFSSLSDMDSPSRGKEKSKSDLEDGELIKSKAKKVTPPPRRRRSSSSSSKRRKRRHSSGRSSSRRSLRRESSFDAAGDGSRRRRQSSDDGGGRRRRLSSDDGGRRRRLSSEGGRRGDLPRYDVRNIIERRRNGNSRSPSPAAASKGKKGKKRRGDRPPHRSPSPAARKRRFSRSRSPPPPSGRRQRRRSRSPSPFRLRGRYSPSPSPPPRPFGMDRWSPGGLGRITPPLRREKSPGVAAGKKGKKGDKSSKKGDKSASKKGKDRSPEILVQDVDSNKKTKKNKGSKKQKNKAVTGTNGEKSKKKRRQQQGDSGSSFPTAASAGSGAPGNVITEKEVFASGDKIMVSVNFRKNSPPPVYNPPTAAEIAAKTKPSAILDLTADDVDYTVVEKSPEPVIDVFSDDENDSGKGNKKKNGQDKNGQDKSNEVSMVTSTVVNGVVVSTSTLMGNSNGGGSGSAAPSNGPSPAVVQILTQAAARTGSGEPSDKEGESNFDLSRGPQTPTEDPHEEDSYDPCDPTESPELDNDGDDDVILDEDDMFNGLLTKEQNGNQKSSAGGGGGVETDIPFLESDKNGGGGDDDIDDGVDNDVVPVDMDMDSPFSPQSSELSDIFEPPSALNTPLTNKKLAAKQRPQHKFSSTSRQKSKASAASGKPSKNKHIHMKIVDDQLKIIDEVPTSAVEMQVKEKFLKKVQRQERAVEEIKMVLKPLYNKKRISKEHYKEILRKCVPKVCHSKKGDINPLKIQKLVIGYVKKYKHVQKRQTTVA